MIVFLFGLLLILVSAAVEVLHRRSTWQIPRFWITAALGVSWLLIALAGPEIQQTLVRIPWVRSVDLLFRLDQQAWVLALITVTAALAYSTAGRPPISGSQVIPGLTGLGILAAAAGNLLSLVVVWVLLDIFLYASHLGEGAGSGEERLSFLPALVIAAGPVILLLNVLLGGPESNHWPEISGSYPGLLTAAGLLRLGLFSAPGSLLQEDPAPDPGRWWIHLIPAQLAVLLIVRSGELGAVYQGPGFEPTVTAFIILAGFLALLSKKEHDFTVFWTLGLFGLVVLAVYRGYPDIALAWGTTLLLGGSLIRLMIDSWREFSDYLLAPAVVFSGLPFTPLWGAVPGSESLFPGWTAALGAGLLLGSGISRAVQGRGRSKSFFRTSSPLFAGSAILILAVFYWVLVSPVWWRSSLGFWQQPFQTWILPLTAGAVVFGARYIPGSLPVLNKLPSGVLNLFRFALRLGEGVLRGTAAAFRGTLGLLEGRGGLVWALLTATLILSLLIRSGG